MIFSREVIFTRARVSLAVLSLRKSGGLLVVYNSLRAYASKEFLFSRAIKANGSLCRVNKICITRAIKDAIFYSEETKTAQVERMN